MLRFDNAAKRPTHLSLNAKVLDAARALGMNLSATVQQKLEQKIDAVAKQFDSIKTTRTNKLQRQIDKIGREGCRQIVPAGFKEDHVELRVARVHLFDCAQVD